MKYNWFKIRKGTLEDHEMEFARSVSDKNLFMADGLIEEFGTPDEVFGKPKSEKTKNCLNTSLEKF